MKKFKNSKKKKKKKRDSNGKIILSNNLSKKEPYPDHLKKKIKIMFLQGKSYGEIILELTDIYQRVPNKGTISRWRNGEDWDAERDKFHRRVEQRAIQEIADTAAQTKGRAYNLLDELENRVRAKLFMIDAFKIDSGKTKACTEVLKKLRLKKPLIIGAEYHKETIRSARNIQRLQVTESRDVAAHDVLACDECVMTRQAYEKILERLSGVKKESKETKK